MKVLVIGSGGKEHAIAWKLSRSRHVNKIYCAPGNAGMAEIAECIDVLPGDFKTLIDFVKYEWIDLTIVDTAELLSQGITDAFQREGCSIFGPPKGAVRLSSSRIFAKDLLRQFGIPAPEYKMFSSYLQAHDFIRLKGAPLVIKTDGHAQKSDIFFARTVDHAEEILRLIMKDKMLGEAGKRVIIEEHIKGNRVSLVAITDGLIILPLTSVSVFRTPEDTGSHSPLRDAGAYSPAHSLPSALQSAVTEKILRPLLKALRAAGISYKGILSVDLIIRKGSPFVFELNSCFQNLEAQTILPRLKTDYVDLVSAALKEKLSETTVAWEEDPALCIAVFSNTDAGPHAGRVPIQGLEKTNNLNDIMVFHENTSFDDNDIVVSGSRVMSVIARANDIQKAGVRAYETLKMIQFKGMHYRRNIGDAAYDCINESMPAEKEIV
jgi:phosphoribosylamine--glycine ligase